MVAKWVIHVYRLWQEGLIFFCHWQGVAISFGRKDVFFSAWCRGEGLFVFPGDNAGFLCIRDRGNMSHRPWSQGQRILITPGRKEVSFIVPGRKRGTIVIRVQKR